MPEPDDRVLAIMIKAPRPGHVKTRLSAAYSSEAIVALYRALVEDTLDLARSTGVRTAAICPANDETDVASWLPDDIQVLPQRGSGLAAGLHSAFEQLCKAQTRRVVAFNADSPHLSPAVLDAAFVALEADDLVVGPCDDGGYYMVGAKRAHPGLFDPSTMGGGSACETLLSRAAQAGLRFTLAREHYDVDVPGDVMRLASDLASDSRRAARTAAVLAGWGYAIPLVSP